MSDPRDPADTAGDDPERTPSFSDSLKAAAQQSGLAQLNPGETPTAGALLGAIGGVRGILESILPGFAFLLIYSITHQLLVSVLVPVAIALIFVVARAGARSPMTQAIAGAIGIALTAALAIFTGRAQEQFLPGILINIGFLIVFIGSIAVRWPVVGLFVGIIMGEGTEWRQDAAKKRALTLATWVWIIPSVVRLALEVPLYLAGNVEALAIVKLVAGIPLYVATLWITWLLVRAVYDVGGAVLADDADDPDPANEGNDDTDDSPEGEPRTPSV